MASARVGILCLCASLWLVPATVGASEEHFPALRELDRQIRGLKQQALAIETDFQALENQRLYPPEQQLRLFLTMEVFDFDLSSVEVSANGIELARHEYTPLEVYALRKGGVQELYLGNISPGVHSLQARFTGQFAEGQDQTTPYEKLVEVSFRKTAQPHWLELRIDRSRGQDLGVRVFQREVQP